MVIIFFLFGYFATLSGVFTTTIDLQQQKVTVTGSVGVDTLIGKLIKSGKHAEIWPENATGKGKSSGKGKKKNEQKDPESVEEENHPSEKSESNLNSHKNKKGHETAAIFDNKSKTGDSKIGANATVNPPAADPNGGETGGAAAKTGGGGSGKKKKKKKSAGGGSNGLSSACKPTPAHTESQTLPRQMNLSPTRQQSYPYYPETYYYPPMVYFSTYNRCYPMGRRMSGPSYYAGLDHDIYQMQSAPLVSFEIFSDENAHGCSIM